MESKSVLQSHRLSWADHANRALESAGYVDRIDHRSLKDQGIDRLPQIHLGPQVKEMDLKGRSIDRGDEYRRIEAANLEQAELLQELRQIEAELLLLDETEAIELQDSVSAVDEMPSLLLPRSILEQYKIQRARLAEQERSAQEILDALKQRGQRGFFNPFGATTVDLQVATAVVRSIQTDRAALEVTVQQLQETEGNRSSESEEWIRQFEILESQEILNFPVNTPLSNSVINSLAMIPDRTLEVQVFLSEVQSRLDQAARQILDDIGTASGSRKRLAEVGSYRITEQDGELRIQISGNVLPQSILQKGELVQGLKKSDLENLEHNAQRVREVLQGQVHQTAGQSDRRRDRER